jgi:hypothetical protein
MPVSQNLVPREKPSVWRAVDAAESLVLPFSPSTLAVLAVTAAVIRLAVIMTVHPLVCFWNGSTAVPFDSIWKSVLKRTVRLTIT